MTEYKRASPETTVEVADGNILPVNGLGTLEVNLDLIRPSWRGLSVVAYVLGLSRNVLPTLKTVEH